MTFIRFFIPFRDLSAQLNLGPADPDGGTRLGCPVCKSGQTAFFGIGDHSGMIPECFCPKDKVIPALGLSNIATDWGDSVE